MKLAINVVTFVPQGKSLPRIFDNPKIFELANSLDIKFNLYVNSPADWHEINNLINGDAEPVINVYGCENASSLGHARNVLMAEAINDGCTHIINLDDDDLLEGIDSIKRVISVVPDKFIYIQRWKDGKFFPGCQDDAGSKILQGKFISNGYACMIMPLELMIRYRLSFPEFVDTFEDNYFYLKLMMNYDGEFYMLANPYYQQITHGEGEFSMSTKALDKIRKEEYQMINQITKFDSYAPKMRVIECHAYNVHELTKMEFRKFCQIYGKKIDTSGRVLVFLNGQFHDFNKINAFITYHENVPAIVINGVEYQIARINDMENFLKFNSHYTTYRLFSKDDKSLNDLREAIKNRYFNKAENPLSEELLSTKIIMVTSWKKLSE